MFLLIYMLPARIFHTFLLPLFDAVISITLWRHLLCLAPSFAMFINIKTQ